MGYLVPPLFATGGNWSYKDCLVIIGDPRYQGYKTPSLLSSGWSEPFARREVE
jgi:hypothetical protein